MRSSTICRIVTAAVLMAVAGCESVAAQRASQRARTENQAAAEIDRICALPAGQREAELKKIQKESGVMLYCGD